MRRGLSTEGKLRSKIDWASLIVWKKFTLFALFYCVFEGNFQVQAGDLTVGFLRYEFGWGAHIWTGLFSELYGICKLGLGVLLVHMIEKTMERAKVGRNSHVSTREL